MCTFSTLDVNISRTEWTHTLTAASSQCLLLSWWKHVHHQFAQRAVEWENPNIPKQMNAPAGHSCDTSKIDKCSGHLVVVAGWGHCTRKGMAGPIPQKHRKTSARRTNSWLWSASCEKKSSHLGSKILPRVPHVRPVSKCDLWCQRTQARKRLLVR